YGTSQREGTFSQLTLSPNETVVKSRERKINGIKAECPQIASDNKHTREVCIDPVSNTLIRTEPFQDKDIVAVGSKAFPRFLSWVKDGKSLAEVHTRELQPADHLPAAMFDPPQGSITRPGCMNPETWRRLSYVSPKYPPADRIARAQGEVTIYVLIDSNGVP